MVGFFNGALEVLVDGLTGFEDKEDVGTDDCLEGKIDGLFDRLIGNPVGSDEVEEEVVQPLDKSDYDDHIEYIIYYLPINSRGSQAPITAALVTSR